MRLNFLARPNSSRARSIITGGVLRSLRSLKVLYQSEVGSIINLILFRTKVEVSARVEFIFQLNLYFCSVLVNLVSYLE